MGQSATEAAFENSATNLLIFTIYCMSYDEKVERTELDFGNSGPVSRVYTGSGAVRRRRALIVLRCVAFRCERGFSLV